MVQHNERCKRFCSYFYLNSQAAAATVAEEEQEAAAAARGNRAAMHMWPVGQRWCGTADWLPYTHVSICLCVCVWQGEINVL